MAEIVVRIVGSGGNDLSSNDQEETSSNSSGGVGEKNKSTSSIARSAIATAGIQVGKQVISKAASSYGDITGDYIKQNEINLAIDTISTGIMAMKFPVGTIAAVASVGFKVGNIMFQQYKSNKQSELLASRTGGAYVTNGDEE